jgi:hypothetical protein
VDEQQQFLSDLRALVDDCFSGVRQQDPPAVWSQRLQRIAELSTRLDRLDGVRALYPPNSAPER